MTTDPEQLRDFARRYTEAWCSGDPAGVGEHCAADGSLTINGGTPSVGRAAITGGAVVHGRVPRHARDDEAEYDRQIAHGVDGSS